MDQQAEENPYKSPEIFDAAAEKTPENKQRDDISILKAVYWAIGQSLFFVLWDMGEIQWLWTINLIAWLAAIILIFLRYKFGRLHIISRWDVIIIIFGAWPILITIFIYYLLKS